MNVKMVAVLRIVALNVKLIQFVQAILAPQQVLLLVLVETLMMEKDANLIAVTQMLQSGTMVVKCGKGPELAVLERVLEATPCGGWIKMKVVGVLVGIIMAVKQTEVALSLSGEILVLQDLVPGVATQDR